MNNLEGINWVIIGACTGTMKDLLPLHHKTNLPMVRYGNKWVLSPPIGAVEGIVGACDKAGIPVFLKDNLKPLLNDLSIVGSSFGRLTELKSLEPKEGPRQRDWYQLRQELPR